MGTRIRRRRSGRDLDVRGGHRQDRPAPLPGPPIVGPGQQCRRPGSLCVWNATHGPGQGALTVRSSGAEVPMGSLLSVIAMTVTVNAPAALEGAAVKVRTVRPPMVAVRGENDAVTPLGRPLKLRATGVP